MLSTKQKKIIELQTQNLVESLFVWNYATNKKSTWIEFADYQEYIDWDDSKNIDWIVSQNEWKLIKRLYSEERELDVHIWILWDENIHFSLYWIDKKNIFEEILYLLSFSTISSQNKLSVLWKNNWKRKYFPLKKSRDHFIKIISEFEAEKFVKKSKEEILLDFNSLPQTRGILFILSSSLDVDLKQLKIAQLKHDVVFCHIFHSFENNLNWNGIISLWDQNNSLHIDLDDDFKKNEYIQSGRKKLRNFRKKIIQSWINYLYFDEKSDIFSEFYKFFKSR
jgi:hypothetical protein